LLALLFAAAVARSPISVTLAAQNSPYNGLCPATLKFAGTITGPPNQPVTYVFNRTIKGVTATGRPNTTTLDGSGHLSVADSFAIDVSQAGAGTDELEVLPAGVKATAQFMATCTTAPYAVRARLFISDGSVSYKDPHAVDLSKCGKDPSPSSWVSSFKSNLKAAFTAEKAYYQEKDRYEANPNIVGFNPEWQAGACIHWVFTVGHYSDTRPSTAFFVTGRHILGGPMYCTTMFSGPPGSTPTGEAAVSMSGGPINTPEACSALPALSTQPLRIPH